MEPAPSREGQLKSSTTLTLPGADDPSKRADAPAAGGAIGNAAEDVQRDSQRLQALEATLAALREQTAQNERTLLALRSELAQARDTRFWNPLVYALIGLLLLALIGLALLWRALRRASSAAWWGEGPDGTGALAAGAARLDENGPVPPSQPASPRMPPGSTFAPLEPEEEPAEETPAAPLPGVMASPAQRMVNTEELFDVQQQSDFFLSLGQHDQAISVLREHISSNPDTSALAYLDLLQIFHSLGRRDEYNRLRQEFVRNFNAEVPEFDRFEEAGRGLDHYGNALARIEAQWPTVGTLPLIEELIFRKPGSQEEESFDLAAYRELLLLYSVAKEVIDPESAPPAPVTPLSFSDTTLHSEMTTAPAPLTAVSPRRGQAAAATLAAAGASIALPRVDKDAPEADPTQVHSLFGGLDQGLQEHTVMAPESPLPERIEPPPAKLLPDRALDFGDMDRTAYETLPTPLEKADESTPDSAAPPRSDPHVIDFELFDPDTEADIAPRKPPKT